MCCYNNTWINQYDASHPPYVLELWNSLSVFLPFFCVPVLFLKCMCALLSVWREPSPPASHVCVRQIKPRCILAFHGDSARCCFNFRHFQNTNTQRHLWMRALHKLQIQMRAISLLSCVRHIKPMCILTFQGDSARRCFKFRHFYVFA